jgi:hypothetical protein
MGRTVRSIFTRPSPQIVDLCIQIASRQVDGQGPKDHHQAAVGGYYYLLRGRQAKWTSVRRRGGRGRLGSARGIARTLEGEPSPSIARVVISLASNLQEADDVTKQMTREEYQHYSDCRQASFSYRKGLSVISHP